MKKKGILFSAAVAALMLGTIAWAAEMTVTTPVTGKITYVDTATGRFTVEEANGSSTTFDSTGATSYMNNGRTVLISDLKVGDQVTVNATGDAGQRTAMSVNYGTTPYDSGNTGSTTTADNQLPRTASPLPLLGIAGLILLGAGAAMKVRTRGVH